MTIFRCNLIPFAALLLQACSGEQGLSEEDLVCNQSPGFIQNTGATADDQIEVVKACIHKWGYRLGRASGSNREIAEAVVGACRGAIDEVLRLKVGEGKKGNEPFADDTWKLFLERYEEEARFRVAQGRAGNCSIKGADQK